MEGNLTSKLPIEQLKPYQVGLIGLALLVLLLPGRAFAATQVWDGGCGGDRAWSCADNWRKDVVPAPGDTVSFNAKSTDTSVVDPGFGGEVATVRLGAGYTGRVVLERSLIASKGFQQYDGEFAAGEHDLSTKAFILKGGAFEASSGTTEISGTMNVTGSPEFDANGGTLVVAGTGGKLICGGIAFHRVAFENTAGTKTVTPSCDLPLGADSVAGAGGSIKLEGVLSGSGSLGTTGLLTLGPAGELSGFTELSASGLTVNGDYDFGGYSRLSAAETFTVNASGDFVAPAGTASFAGKFRVLASSGFDANGGTVIFDGAANSSVACGNKAFHLVRFEQTGVRTVEKDCSLPLGTNPTLGAGNSARVKLKGTLSGGGTLGVDRDLTLNPSAQLAGFGGLDVQGELSVISTTLDFHSYAPFSIEGDYTQAAGKVTVPGGTDVNGSFTLNPRAVFEAPSGTIAVAGDFSVSPKATFHANGGTVALVGSGQTVSGNTTFNNLTKVAGSSDTLTFASGDTQTVQGLLTLQGKNPTNLLTLVPTIPGSPWKVNRAGTDAVKFVSVADSTNVGAPIVATESQSEGGNSGWAISAAAVKLVLEAQTATPAAGSTDDLTIIAEDAYGNTAASYTGTHNVTFGPVAESPSGAIPAVTNLGGAAVGFGSPTPISFDNGVATPSEGKNGAMTLVKAGSISIMASDGSISNDLGLALAVSPGSAERLAWTNVASSGDLDTPCLFTCTGKQLGKSGYFKANVSVTDSLGNTISNLGSGHKVTVESNHGSVIGGNLAIATTGPAESTTKFAYAPSTGGNATIAAETTGGTTYADAIASMVR